MTATEAKGGRNVVAPTLTPWDHESKRIHPEEGIAPTIAGSDGQGGQRMPYVAVERTVGALQHRDYKGVGSQYVNEGKVVVGVINMQGSKGNAVATEEDVSYTLNKMHGHDVHAVVFESRIARNDRGKPEPVVPPLKAQSGEGDSAPLIAIQHSIIGRKSEAGAQGKGWRDDGKSWTLDGRGEADAVIVSPTIGADIARQAGGHPGIEEYTYATLRAGYGVRRLTPTECERLQGFPDGHTDVNNMSDSARYRMLGNAVAVPVAEWIGRRIVALEEEGA